ncbi:hypothetical protein [Streptomyces sp. NWU339]|uniref:hypothetical protein n=1 Tax=Streptomyces sp. NWU339 TaxID=2185284 RepID=UPI0015E80431|nr:hypothetical protein [Streptomyces sp. NWU339]
MTVFRRFMLGLACAIVAGAVTAAIPPVAAWWWIVAIIVAVLVWFGEYAGDL